MSNFSQTTQRKDKQITGLAGELFVAAELLKRGFQTSVTFGNAKAIDLFALNPSTGRTFAIQVKSLRKKNFFLLAHKNVEPKNIYVFVLLNDPGEAVRYFIVPGSKLASDPQSFRRYFLGEKMPGIHVNSLIELGYENVWSVFDDTEQPL